jgi:hypothetical protein
MNIPNEEELDGIPTARNEEKRSSVTGEETGRGSSGVIKARRWDEAQQNKSHPPTIVETSRLPFL